MPSTVGIYMPVCVCVCVWWAETLTATNCKEVAPFVIAAVRVEQELERGSRELCSL